MILKYIQNGKATGLTTQKSLDLINTDDLVNEMRKQSALVRHHGDIVVRMEHIYNKISSKLEVTKANIAKKYRKRYQSWNEKITESALHELVVTHTDVMKAQDEYLEAKRKLGIAKSQLKSSLVRTEMISNAGHMIREELKLGIRKPKKRR